jgi:hypothetical protein
MTCSSSRHTGRWLLGLLLITALAACGDDDDDRDKESDDAGRDAGGDSGRGGAGRTSGTGGTGGTGMTRPTGGRGGNTVVAGSPADAAYTCEPPRGDIGGPGGVGSMCCGALGACAANPNGGDQPGLPHDTCAAQSDLRCVPLPGAAAAEDDAGSGGAFATCRVTFPGAPAGAPSYEGRCLPACFAASNPLLARLQRAGCAEAELCTPCFNPLTGESTGTCDLNGDAPSEAAPTPFVDCSDGAGYCVPTFAAGMAANELQQLTCASGELCAPKVKVANPQACFERCNTALLGPGACVPSFLTSDLAMFLRQETCGMGELCAPCEAVGMRTTVCD